MLLGKSATRQHKSDALKRVLVTLVVLWRSGTIPAGFITDSVSSNSMRLLQCLYPTDAVTVRLVSEIIVKRNDKENE